MWVSIVVVSIRVRFFVFGGSGKNDIVRICCNGVFCFCGEFGYFLEILPNFFVSLTVSVKMSLSSVLSHILQHGDFRYF